MRFLPTICVLLSFVTIAPAQRNLKEIPDPDPELQRQTFQLPEGFVAELFASDPVIAKPIHMNFDTQGRLWVVSSKTYPQIEPGSTPEDEVIVLEDTDADGKADRHTVFARGLFIPTGIAPGDGGAYIANSTQLLHLSDTDADGIADEQKVVLSGFGTEDTHHLLHTLRWGPGGYLYMNQSIYIHSHIETPHGIKRLNGGGVWKFRPDNQELDVFVRGLINPWGHHIDRYGQSFATDGAGGEGINYLVPGAAYPTAVGVRRILHGMNPGSPKHCGLEILSGRHLPEQWRGQFITNDFRGHRVCRFDVERSSEPQAEAGYTSTERGELIVSDHVAFRPIDVKMGPDGCIYIADWYNPIIQHGEVDFRDPRRDQVHGRIWRIRYTGHETLPNPNVHRMMLSELVAALDSPETWTREQARLRLRESDPANVVAEVRTALETASSDEFRLELLWATQSVRRTDPELLKTLLRSENAGVRAAAVRVLSDVPETSPNPIATLNRLAGDTDAQVRMEAVRALGQFKTADAFLAVLNLLDHPIGPLNDYAVRMTLDEMQSVWQPLVAERGLELFPDLSVLVRFVELTGTKALTSPLLTALTDPRLAADRRATIAGLLVRTGSPQDWAAVLKAITGPEATSEMQVAALQSWLALPTNNRARPAGDLQVLRSLLDSENTTVIDSALRLSGRWKVERFREELESVARSRQRPLSTRSAALEGLRTLGGQKSASTLIELSSQLDSQPLRVFATAQGVKIAPKAAASSATQLFQAELTEDETRELISTFLELKTGPEILTAALQDSMSPINPDVARLALRVVSGSGRPQPALTDAITKAGRLTSTKRTMTAEEAIAFVNDVAEIGDPARGEEIYRIRQLNCIGCHAIGDAGGKVGPNLVSLGGSARPDYILESLLEPNKKVKEGYQTLVVATIDGEVLNGIKVRQTDEQIILRDAKDNEFGVALADIDEMVNGKSMMPEGLTDTLTRNELVHLVRFLSELGRTPKYTLSKSAVVRKWEVMLPTREAAFRLRRTSDKQATTDDEAFQWQSVYSRVDGSLPATDIPAVSVKNRVATGNRGVGFVRFDLEVTTAGEVKLVPTKPDTIRVAWAGREPLDIGAEVAITLPRGRHRITLSVDSGQPLSITIQNGTGVARAVGGK